MFQVSIAMSKPNPLHKCSVSCGLRLTGLSWWLFFWSLVESLMHLQADGVGVVWLLTSTQRKLGFPPTSHSLGPFPRGLFPVFPKLKVPKSAKVDAARPFQDLGPEWTEHHSHRALRMKACHRASPDLLLN